MPSRGASTGEKKDDKPQPPYLKPSDVSSSGPSGACMTPSNVMNDRTIIFLIVTASKVECLKPEVMDLTIEYAKHVTGKVTSDCMLFGVILKCHVTALSSLSSYKLAT